MEVYATLLLTDSYLPGAQVLAHSLRDGGATRKLAVLVTQEYVSQATMDELNRLYDYVIPVERITNRSHGNLALMGRLDLSSAFTKIHLWRLTQFSKIVYVDADVVALRAPEELFEVEERFAASPDIGWPDCFNSGVMVLKPDMGTYNGLLNLAQRGISFDGADQGLLNEYFRDWHRLSFVYNVTPSAHYQYAPAYSHFRSSVTMAHFIGPNKPWAVGRGAARESASTPYTELMGRWWAVWDAHYRPVTEQDPSKAWDQQSKGTRNIPPHFERPNPMPTEYDPNFRREHGSWDAQPKNVAVWQPPPVAGSEPSQQQQQQVPSFTVPLPNQTDAPQVFFLPMEHVPYVPREIPYDAYEQSQGDHQENQQAPPQYQPHDEKTVEQQLEGVHLHAPQPQLRQWQDQGRRFSEEIPDRIDNSLPLPPVFAASDADSTSQSAGDTETETETETEVETEDEAVFEAPMQEWNAERFSPPPNSKPEAHNWPSQVYENQWDSDRQDTALFVPPPMRSPPANLHFSVPPRKKDSEDSKPAPIFPWEHNKRSGAPTRVFAGDEANQKKASSTPRHVPETEEASGYSGWNGMYGRGNAWDSIPSIDRYVASFQRSTIAAKKQKQSVRERDQRELSRGQDGSPNAQMRVADTRNFSNDRNSDYGYDDEGEEGEGKMVSTPTLRMLPPEISVTPTPFRMMRGYRSAAMDDESRFPSAEGIPDQKDWDPLRSLQELRNAPGELLQRSPPEGQSLRKGSANVQVGGINSGGLVSSSMPVPEKEFHITAFQRRHMAMEMMREQSGSSVEWSGGSSPVTTFTRSSEDDSSSTLDGNEKRAYSTMGTQTDTKKDGEERRMVDAGVQGSPEEIDLAMGRAS